MPEAVLVPAVPTIGQTDSPEEIARVTENMQRIFDKVSPHIRGTPTPETEKADTPKTETVKPEEPTVSKETTPPEPSTPPETVEAQPSKVPSFIEKALEVPEVKSDEAKPDAQSADQEWPEELPTFKSKEESRESWKKFREAYKKAKTEAEQLRSRPVVDQNATQELEILRGKTKEMEQQLSRLGVEQHQEFQTKIIAPMQQAWNEASRIVHEAGGNPDDLAKALSLSGKAHFEALDEIMSGMPESAKIETTEAIRQYKRMDDQRRRALADAPRTAEALKKQDMERNLQYLNQQKDEMRNMFDNAIKTLRDEAKVEVLQKSDDPDAKFWNNQADELVDTARKLFLENTDMSKVAFALALAPMTDVYRKLWLTERDARTKSEKVLKQKFGSEPSISESGGNVRGATPDMKDDLKKPFTDVFLREFHRARSSGS